MFRGTKAYPPEKYQDIVTRSGARQNAYTTDDYTNYHTTFPKEDLETILKIEADRFQNLAYTESAFKTEARAVLGEYNKNSANPIQKLFEVQRESAFNVHTYKHTTMGFLKDIEDMPNQFEYSKTFFARWYRPEHVTVIVAGDVKPDAVFPLVEKYWGGWKRGAHSVAVPQEPPARGPVYAHVPWPSDTLSWVTVAFHGPAFSETKKDLRGDRHALRPVVRPDLRPLQAPRRAGAEGGRALPERGHQRGPGARHGVRPPQEGHRSDLHARRDPEDRRGPAREARRRQAPSGCEIERPLLPRANARQHRDDRRGPRAASSGSAARTERSTRTTGSARRSRPPTSRPRHARTSRTRTWS